MADALRNALERKLAAYEAAGMDDRVKLVRARLAELPTEEEPAEEADLDSLTKDELRELAEERGVEISSSMTKAELVEALEEA